MKRGFDCAFLITPSLLLAVFIATLILDMGGGPVFIVYASLNLSRNAVVPAATWLFVLCFLVPFTLDSWYSEHHSVCYCNRAVHSREQNTALVFAKGGTIVLFGTTR